MLPASFCHLADLLAGRTFVALTGAGCSTESGIPDYRGIDSGQRTPSPVRYGEFVNLPEARARYWARSSVGWPRIARARPNPAHRALARLELHGALAGVITQNVDGLHRAAGSRRVVELHGSLGHVVCLGCRASEDRASVQERLLALNPGWSERSGVPAPDGEAEVAPDGDVHLPDRLAASFTPPACRRCGGVLKPDVTFFGENVPPPRVEEAWRLLERGAALLVVGSSLAVYSGYRFVRGAADEGRRVAIVNLGETRGDAEATVRVRGRAGEVLPALADELL